MSPSIKVARKVDRHGAPVLCDQKKTVRFCPGQEVRVGCSGRWGIQVTDGKNIDLRVQPPDLSLNIAVDVFIEQEASSTRGNALTIGSRLRLLSLLL